MITEHWTTRLAIFRGVCARSGYVPCEQFIGDIGGLLPMTAETRPICSVVPSACQAIQNQLEGLIFAIRLTGGLCRRTNRLQNDERKDL